MQTTQIDGVTTFWEQGPEPFTAALVFGVGARHETFRTIGVTHLIEHLVMGTLPKSALDRNAEVGIDTTVFYATGREQGVVDFVNQVCRAVSALPLERIELERGVLEVEDSVADHPAVAASLRVRYGFQGPGLAASTGPGPRTLTSEHVTEHARRHFTRDNVRLVLSGPPPLGLELTLPGGRPVEVPSVDHVDVRLPARVHGEHFGVVALSGIVTLPDCAGFVGEILRERIEDTLRGRLGISYDVGTAGANLGVGESMPVVWADGRDDSWQTVVESVWTALRDVAETGPDAPELSLAKERALTELEDPRAVVGWLIHQAGRSLAGLVPRSRSEQVAIDEAVTAQTIRTAAEQMMRTALVLIPTEGVELDGLPDVTDDEPPSGAEVAGRAFRRRLLARSPRDLVLHLGDDSLSVTAGGVTDRVQWSDVVGVASAPGARGIVAADGRVLPVMAKYFRDGDELVAAIDARAGDLLFPSDPEDFLG